jgi:predicted nucleic acid-binding protein
VTLLYADTSAIVCAYFADESDHEMLSKLLLTGPDPVVTSELTRVEFASARTPRAVLDRFDEDCGESGPFTMLRLDTQVAMPLARKLVVQHPVRTLAALHLAVAITDATALAAGADIGFVTRDKQQGRAAKDLGLIVL